MGAPVVSHRRPFRITEKKKSEHLEGFVDATEPGQGAEPAHLGYGTLDSDDDDGDGDGGDGSGNDDDEKEGEEDEEDGIAVDPHHVEVRGRMVYTVGAFIRTIAPSTGKRQALNLNLTRRTIFRLVVVRVQRVLDMVMG